MALTALAATSLQAQLTPADSVRLRAEIASALLEFEWNYTRPLAFRLGRAGGSIPDSLVPEGFRILGGTGGSTLLLESPMEAPEAERTIRAHLEARGLTPFEPRQQWGREEGFVFRQASSATSGLLMRQYCAGSTLFRVNVRPQWPEKGTGSLAYLRSSGTYAPCSPEAEQPPVMDDEPTLEMPVLRPPPGATSNGSGMSGGSGSGSYQRTARAEVRSEMSTRDIILFYAAQLAEQGWTVAQPAIVAEAAVVSARKVDKEGRDLQGILADVRSPQGLHYMTFQIDRRSTRRRDR
jgi:hypothetical protein